MYALTEIKGVGRRLSNVICKKADVDLAKRAGELNSDELERIVNILQNPQEFKIPDWMLNRQRGEFETLRVNRFRGSKATFVGRLGSNGEGMKMVRWWADHGSEGLIDGSQG